MSQYNFDLSPTIYPNGANQAALTAGGEYFRVATKGGTVASSVPAGMMINDVAIDPDTGDAYFTDSYNCRECHTVTKVVELFGQLS
jgi:hypothetical protein